jgi:hypothetical protein
MNTISTNTRPNKAISKALKAISLLRKDFIFPLTGRVPGLFDHHDRDWLAVRTPAFNNLALNYEILIYILIQNSKAICSRQCRTMQVARRHKWGTAKAVQARRKMGADAQAKKIP